MQKSSDLPVSRLTKRRNRFRGVGVAIFFILLLGSKPATMGVPSIPGQTANLGKVQFANSCLPVVQPDIDRGVAMLHSFQYGAAEKIFIRITEADPGCAIAYWGAAMTLYHQLWDWPTPATLEKGRRYLAKARLLPEKSAREAAYLNAAEVFYRPERQLEAISRVQAYSDAMRRLHQSYPEDSDATAFYALSLLTLPSSDDESQDNQRKAIAILEKLFAAQPEHPGAAHYLIHATDTAEFAPLGLAAARSYARIAPASPHALHMPSHIFARLGMWQDSIASNLASIAAAQRATREHWDDGSGDELHAVTYLAYSYLQSGDDQAARRTVESIKDVSGATANDIVNNAAILGALYAVETHDWKKAAELPADPSAFPYARVRTFWARAIGAARTGNVMEARQELEKLDRARAGMVSYMQNVDCQMHTGHASNAGVSVQQLEARAWLAWAEGKPTEALATMRAAVAREDAYGVESRTVPAYEMLGDLLFEMHQSKAALAAYLAALKEAPLRFNALTGAARASQAAGDLPSARSYYSTLINCCSPTSGRKEFEEAKMFLSGN
jgi:tetratricopeptide (TPR) repeat protein